MVGACLIFVDDVVRIFPRYRNFRIQASSEFQASALSLSFGVMVGLVPSLSHPWFRYQALVLTWPTQLFSSLYSMLPSSKEYLNRAGYSKQAAGLILMACFVGGWLGIQAISRLLHKVIPSHVVDCNHSHAADDDEGETELEDEHHSGDHFHHDPRVLHRQRTSSTSDSVKFYNHGAQNGMVNESSPLLSADRERRRPSGLFRHWSNKSDLVGGAKRPSLTSLRRPSMVQVQQQVVSFVKDTKANCDEGGPCYGYSDPCGHECFKHLKIRRNRPSNATTVTASTLTGHTFPGFSEVAGDDSPLPSARDFSINPRIGRVRSREADLIPYSGISQDTSTLYRNEDARPSLEDAHGPSSSGHRPPPAEGAHYKRPETGARAKPSDVEAQSHYQPPTIDEEETADDESLTSSHVDSHASHGHGHATAGSSQHHHHVPTNAFLSIGLQTSIAIAIHKFPEGFITYATNHANPSLGFAVFMALFVHNITEGFALALPLYMALGSRLRAVLWASLLGGLSQPIGAGLAALWFGLARRNAPYMEPDEAAYGCLFAVTAGIMASVALRLFVEALALAHRAEQAMAFAFFGMTLMGASNALVS